MRTLATNKSKDRNCSMPKGITRLIALMSLAITLTLVLACGAAEQPAPQADRQQQEAASRTGTQAGVQTQSPAHTSTAASEPVRGRAGQSDVEGMAGDWLIANGREIAAELVEEAARRKIPIEVEADEAAQQIEANLSITVGEWEPADISSVPAVVTFQAVFEDWGGGLLIVGELPVTLAMDLAAGRATGGGHYGDAMLCFGQKDLGVVPETCEERGS